MANLTTSGYRSSTEYCFDQEHANAIVQSAAYHRKDYCLSMIWFSPREHADVRQSTLTSFRCTSNVELGSLDSIPLELLYEMLSFLDMYSLFKFRQMNRRSRQLVDSLRQYQIVVSHGLNLLCALLRTRLAVNISLLDFYNALCTKACTICGEFGGFISILLWRRCCFKCVNEAPDIQLQSRTAVRKQLHLTKLELDNLTSLKTLPGVYTMEEIRYKSRRMIVSVHQAILAYRRQTGSFAQAQRASLEQNRKFNFMGSCALPYYDQLTGKVEHGMSCAGCQLALEKNIIGTRGEEWAFEARDKVYARDGFLEHFRWCEQAQLLWRSSDEGNNLPPMLPEAARRGGYFNERE